MVFVVVVVCLLWFENHILKTLCYTIRYRPTFVFVAMRLKVSEPVLTVADPTKVRVFGPAVDKPVTIHEPTYFVIDVSKAGPGEGFELLMIIITVFSSFRGFCCDQKSFFITVLSSCNLLFMFCLLAFLI